MKHQRRIVLAVTADISLTLMRGVPRYLADQGWEVHVVSSPGDHLFALRDEPGVVTHELAMERNPSILKDLVALLRWILLLGRIRPDVLSAGTPKAGLLAVLAGWLTRVPKRIYHLRGLRLETARGLQRRILTLLERLAARAATNVLSVSPSLRARAIELGLVQSDKVEVLGAGSSNGVQWEDFAPDAFSSTSVDALRAQIGLDPNLPVVGFVGRLTLDKGLAVLAEARQLLEREGVDYQLLVVGQLDDREEASYLADLASSGRQPFATGYVPSPAIYYQLMDIFCLPTYREGFPNVVLEASAAGLPTITTRATGAMDSVIEGSTGILVDVEDAPGLAAAISTLVRNDEARLEMGRQALLWVRERFDRRQMWGLLGAYYSADLVPRGRRQ